MKLKKKKKKQEFDTYNIDAVGLDNGATRGKISVPFKLDIRDFPNWGWTD